jgi:hypothetical protein
MDDNDDSYSDDYSDSDDEVLTEQEEMMETAVVKALVEASMSGRIAKPVLNRILRMGMMEEQEEHQLYQQEQCFKKARLLPTTTTTGSTSTATSCLMATKRPSMRMTVSAPALSSLNVPTSATPFVGAINKQQQQQKPDDLVKSLVEQAGLLYQTFPALELENFFVPVTPESIAAFDCAVLYAVRTQDIETLENMHRAGRTLQCGNQFGETIVHTASRTGLVQVLKYLIHDAHVNVRVVCDYGRTPLHDACWTAYPLWPVIDLLLNACPDFLFICDKRGFTPLQYIRPEHAGEWCEYLLARGAERLVPRELVLLPNGN